MTHTTLPQKKVPHPLFREHEEVVMVITKHWIVYVWHVIGAILTVGVAILAPILTTIYLDMFSQALTLIFTYLILLYASFLLLKAWLNNGLDMMILTTERLIDITQHDLLHRDVTEASLNQIQDVKSTSKGVTATVFGIGSITIQTAGKNPNFAIEDIPYPARVAKLILDATQVFGLVKEEEPLVE